MYTDCYLLASPDRTRLGLFRLAVTAPLPVVLSPTQRSCAANFRTCALGHKDGAVTTLNRSRTMAYVIEEHATAG